MPKAHVLARSSHSEIESPPPELTLRSIAREVCPEFSDPEKQIAAVKRALHSRGDLRAKLLDELEDTAVKTAVYSARHAYLAKIKAGSPGHCRRGLAAIAGVAEALEAAMLDWPMPDGRLLGEYGHADLLAASNDDKLTADGLLRRASFFGKLAELTPDGKTVRQAVGAIAARKIWRQIEAT